MKSDADPQIVLPELLQEQVGEWTLLLFWASWSATGRRLKQELETAVRPPEVKVLSLRVEDATSIVTALAIPSVPYLVLLHAGTEVARHPGTLRFQTSWSGCRRGGLADQLLRPSPHSPLQPSCEESVRRIVIRPTQLLDMQYLGPQVLLVLRASVGVVMPGDQVITQRYGDWLVKAVDSVSTPENTVISVIADLSEDADLIGPVHGSGQDMDA